VNNQLQQCSHVYGYHCNEGLIDEENYEWLKGDSLLVKFTYCPYCRAQVHTLDGIPLGLIPDDDCEKGGCAD
jgi:hypothetical protein